MRSTRRCACVAMGAVGDPGDRRRASVETAAEPVRGLRRADP
jgi:hypothetical protein